MSNQGGQVDNKSNIASNIDRYDDMLELELTSDEESADEADKSDAKVFEVAQKLLQRKSGRSRIRQLPIHHVSTCRSNLQLNCQDTSNMQCVWIQMLQQAQLTSTQKQDVTMHTADNGTATIDTVGFCTLYVLNTKSQP